jgi:hypothetical protein
MKLLRKLNEEDAATLRKLAEKPELKQGPEPYYGLDRDDHADDIKTLHNILEKSIAGFERFCSFMPNNDNIRFLYDYGYDGQGISFEGVGYISVDDVCNGFFKELRDAAPDGNNNDIPKTDEIHEHKIQEAADTRVHVLRDKCS